MGLVQTIAPSVEPITLAQARQRMRITAEDDGDDTDIEGMITTARMSQEKTTGRQCITATWEWTLDAFPASTYANPEGLFHVPISPVISVTSIKYYDVDNAEQTWSTDEYQVDTTDMVTRIRLVFGYSYPDTYDRMSAVKVTFTAGHGATPADVPGPLKDALQYRVAQLYEMRQPVITGTIVANVDKTIEYLEHDYIVRRAG